MAKRIIAYGPAFNILEVTVPKFEPKSAKHSQTPSTTSIRVLSEPFVSWL